MESWNQVINTALLGTDKRELKKEALSADFSDALDLIAQSNNTKEDIFLQTASLVYNYRQCGVLPLRKDTVSIANADVENKQYASSFSHHVLYDIVETGSIPLFRFWLEQCVAKEKIVQPEVIPLLLDAAVKQKELQVLIRACCGNRGLWLAQFNEAWKYAEEVNDDDLWQTGTLEQRKKLLAKIRKDDPAKGREMLQQVWAQENAAGKTELMQQLSINANSDDVAWLEELLNEKSIKVKEEVLSILKLIPSSSIIQSYWNILQQSIKVTTSKGLLGIGTKTILEVNLAPIEEAIFKTGIEKLSSDKKTADEVFILYQLMKEVPPQFWEQHFGMEPKDIIKLFAKEEKYGSFIQALGQTAGKFKDLNWMRAVIENNDTFFEEALAILPQPESEKYALRFFDKDERAVSSLEHLLDYSSEWSTELAKAVLRFTAKSPYQFNKAFYNNIVHLLPIPIAGELEKCTPKEEHFRAMWSNLSGYIIKLLELKLQTLKAFNE